MGTAPAAEPRLYTAEDLAGLPSEARYELIEGELRPMPPPAGDEHGTRTMRLSARVAVFAEDNNLGRCYAAETGFLVARNPDTILAPDFGFVSRERLVPVQPEGFVPVAPDLVLETRSPNDRPPDVAEKVRWWLHAGVQIVWELDPRARVLTVYRPGVEPRALGVGDALTGEELLPGFALPLARLFPEEERPDELP
jgi:Uma2 family endonuclease